MGSLLPDGTYRTSQGDMWDNLARELLGSEKYMYQLIDANPDYQDTVIFSAGIYLTVPQIDTATTSEALPPWKK
jgi:phage tail protein X